MTLEDLKAVNFLAEMQKLQDHPTRISRYYAEGYRSNNTPNSKKIVAKLDHYDAPELIQQARDFEVYQGASVEECKKDFGWFVTLPGEKELRREGRSLIREIYKDIKPYIKDKYSPERLEWLWSFHWTCRLWGVDKVGDKYIYIYSLVRGPRPYEESTPFSTILNYARKDLTRERYKNIYLAAKDQHISKLLTLGLTEEQAKICIELVNTTTS